MAKPARTLMELPELAGWLTFGEAAVEMGISVERVRQLASNPNPRLTTAHRIGRRPLGIIREAEVRQWVERKRQEQEEAAAKQEEAAAGEAVLRAVRRPVRHPLRSRRHRRGAGRLG